MNDQLSSTSAVDQLLQRMRDGDANCQDDLFAAIYQRLESLAQHMLRRFPGVGRCDETGDVLHDALIRLMRSLEKARPASEKKLLARGRELVRRELDNLAHRYAGPAWGTTHDRKRAGEGGEQDDREESNDLEKWAAFQEAVERLPTVEREVVSLLFYHHWTQAEVGELLDVTDRTVRNRLQSASRKLRAALAVQ
jgi:RNA polymerase sigma factor (sigma-70 family)